jgi:RNA polymerase sigma-70 factor (ECF subfamily)
LPEEQKDVLVMRFIVGLPIAEVAAAMHKSQDAIKGLQRRGIITLREKFEELELTQ